jgi:hypothetical protein
MALEGMPVQNEMWVMLSTLFGFVPRHWLHGVGNYPPLFGMFLTTHFGWVDATREYLVAHMSMLW